MSTLGGESFAKLTGFFSTPGFWKGDPTFERRVPGIVGVGHDDGRSLGCVLSSIPCSLIQFLVQFAESRVEGAITLSLCGFDVGQVTPDV